MIGGAARERLQRALALMGILALSAGGTVALTDPGEPSLAIFDRPATAAELAKSEQLATDSIFIAGSRPEVRLLLQEPGPDAPDAHEVWAVLLPGPVQEFEGDAVCLLTSRRGSEREFLAGCMLADDVARRGFVPLDRPRPTLTIDGEASVIAWGPRGDARLIERPTPPSSEPAP